MAEDAIEGMRHDGEAALRMHQFDAALDALIRRDAAAEEERQHMALARADLFADDHLEGIAAPSRRDRARAAPPQSCRGR